jgi:hypothetical protein
MRYIRIDAGNGRSISEEMHSAMDLLDDAGISYEVNVVVADDDEDATTLVFHGARIRFTAGHPLGDASEKQTPTTAARLGHSQSRLRERLARN